MAAVPGGGKYIYIYISPILCKKGTPTKQQFYRRSKKQTFKKLSSLLQTKYLSYQNNITHTHTHTHTYIYICYKSKLWIFVARWWCSSCLIPQERAQRYWKEGWMGHRDSLNGLGKRIPLPYRESPSGRHY